jgi:hypothetical protein
MFEKFADFPADLCALYELESVEKEQDLTEDIGIQHQE